MEIYDDDLWITAVEIAQQLAVSEKWVYRNRHQLGLPGKKFGRKVRFNKRLFLEWLKTQPE